MISEIVSWNPAREFEEVGRVRCSTESQISSAFTAAKDAFPTWRKMAIEDRCVYVNRFRELLEEHAGEVAQLQSTEIGKPITESQQELVSAIRFLKNQTEKAAKLVAPRIIDSYSTHQTVAHYEPYGVAAVITPWNFPTGRFVANSSRTLLAGRTWCSMHSWPSFLRSLKRKLSAIRWRKRQPSDH